MIDITGLQQFSMHLLGVLNYTLRFVNVQTEVFNLLRAGPDYFDLATL